MGWRINELGRWLEREISRDEDGLFQNKQKVSSVKSAAVAVL